MLIECYTQLVHHHPTPNLSVDAPYEDIEEGQAWWKELEKNKVLDEVSLRKVGRENAIKLMKLPLN